MFDVLALTMQSALKNILLTPTGLARLEAALATIREPLPFWVGLNLVNDDLAQQFHYNQRLENRSTTAQDESGK